MYVVDEGGTPPMVPTGFTKQQAYDVLTGRIAPMTAAGMDDSSVNGYDDDAEETKPDGDDDSDVDAQAEMEHTGAMIALVPSDADLARIALQGGENQADLHLTLYFLGEAEQYDMATQQELLARVQSVAAEQTVVTGMAFGVAVWNPLGDDPCVVLNVGGQPVESAQREMCELLEDLWAAVLPEQHCPWSPHICLAYDSDPTRFVRAALDVVGPITFDKIRVAFAGESVDVPLGFVGLQ